MLGDRVLQGWSCLRGEGVYWSPRAALTKGHKLGPGGGRGASSRHSIRSGAWKSETKESAQPCSLRGSRGRFFLASGGCRDPWHSLACPFITPSLRPWSHDLLPCVSVCPLPFSEGHQVMDFRPTLIRNSPNYICEDTISNEGHILRFQVDVSSGGPAEPTLAGVAGTQGATRGA